MNKSIITKHEQSGLVLVVCLIMLLVLTLVGVTGTQVTSLEEKMAGNLRDQNIAFQAAESTLLAAEAFVLDAANPPTGVTYTGAGGLLDQGDAEPNYFLSSTWAAANSAATPAGFAANYGIQDDPRYIIKIIGNIPANGVNGPKTIFRITARALGANPGTQIILQEVFEREN